MRSTPSRTGPAPLAVPEEIVPFYLFKLAQNQTGTIKTIVSRLRTMSAFFGGFDVLRSLQPDRLTEYRTAAGKPLADKTRMGYEYTLADWQRFLAGNSKVPHREAGITDRAALAHPQLEEFGVMIGAGLSQRTVRPYTEHLRMLYEFTFEKFPEARVDPPKFFQGPNGKLVFQAFQGLYAKGVLPGQRGKVLNRNSVATMQSSIRRWCGVFSVPDITSGGAFVGRQPHETTHPISRDQRFALFTAAADEWNDDDNARAEIGRAWYAFLMLTCVQGMREASAFAFRPADLRRTGRKTARLTLAQSKGYERRAPQIVKSTPALCEFFSAYFEDPNVRVLAPLGGTRPAQLGPHFRAWTKRHGIQGVRPHMLRAFMISEHVDLFGDIDATCDLIGHADINTTRGYATHKDDLGDREDWIDYPDDRKDMHTFGALWLPESFAGLRTERDAWLGLPVAPVARLRPRVA